MIINVESIEVLLQVSFGRGIKHLSIPPTDPNHERLLQAGEKLCVASLKTFLVSRTRYGDLLRRLFLQYTLLSNLRLVTHLLYSYCILASHCHMLT